MPAPKKPTPKKSAPGRQANIPANKKQDKQYVDSFTKAKGGISAEALKAKQADARAAYKRGDIDIDALRRINSAVKSRRAQGIRDTGR